VRIEKIAESHHLETTWTAFPLHPETPDEGRRLDDLFASSPGYIQSMWPRLQAAGLSVGINLPDRTYTYNSRRAHELAKWAEQQDCGPAFHKAVYTAFFHEGRNIALPSVLEQIVSGIGLDADSVVDVLESGTFSEAVDRDWQHCQELGIRSVPTFMSEEKTIVGFSSEEELLRLIRREL
jgi:predicted DsbA family dithiol-disulfide isomerase